MLLVRCTSVWLLRLSSTGDGGALPACGVAGCCVAPLSTQALSPCFFPGPSGCGCCVLLPYLCAALYMVVGRLCADVPFSCFLKGPSSVSVPRADFAWCPFECDLLCLWPLSLPSCLCCFRLRGSPHGVCVCKRRRVRVYPDGKLPPPPTPVSYWLTFPLSITLSLARARALCLSLTRS